MPRIWADTIDTHRKQVTDAILDATADLIAEQGPMSVAMAAIAERAGIGRATLYKYFSDVESIVMAWHARGVEEHLAELTNLAQRDEVTLMDLTALVRSQRREHTSGDARGVLDNLAHTVAGLGHGPHAVVHDDVARALARLLRRLREAGEVRRDLEPAVLAKWLMHAVHAPKDLSNSAVERLVVDSLAPDIPPPSSARRRRATP